MWLQRLKRCAGGDRRPQARALRLGRDASRHLLEVRAQDPSASSAVRGPVSVVPWSSARLAHPLFKRVAVPSDADAGVAPQPGGTKVSQAWSITPTAVLKKGP